MSASRRRPYHAIAHGTFTEMIGLGLSRDAMLVRFYLLTCDHGRLSGYFRLPISYIAADTTMSEPTARAALEELERADLIQYDEEHGFVALTDFYSHDPVCSFKNGRAVLKAWDALETSLGMKMVKALAMKRSAAAILNTIPDTRESETTGSQEREGVRRDAEELMNRACEMEGGRDAASDGGSEGAPDSQAVPHPHPRAETHKMPTATTSAPQLRPRARSARPSDKQIDLLQAVAVERDLDLDEVLAALEIDVLTADLVDEVLTKMKSGSAAVIVEKAETDARNAVVAECRRIYADGGAVAARKWALRHEPDLSSGLLSNIQTWEMDDQAAAGGTP